MSRRKCFSLILTLVLLVSNLSFSLSAAPLPLAAAAPAPSASFGEVTFCQEVTGDGQPVKPATMFAQGTKVVHALFTYQGMTDGSLWRREWKRDGRLLSGADDTWAAGESGWAEYPLEDAAGLRPGKYTFNLYVEGELIRQASFTIGTALVQAQPKPEAGEASFGPITFCEDVSDPHEPINAADRFRTDAPKIYALFQYQNIPSGAKWGRVWEKNGEVYASKRDLSWDRGADGWFSPSLGQGDGNNYEAGSYTLKLYLGDELAQSGSFEVYVKKVEGIEPTFGGITFAKDVSAAGEPVSPGWEFDFDTPKVCAFYAYGNMTRQTKWGREWLRDGKELLGDTRMWIGQAGGVDYDCVTTKARSLSPGEYKLTLYVDGERSSSASFIVLEPDFKEPARAEDIVDPELMPAWRRLISCPTKQIQDLAKLALKYHIFIRFGDDLGAALAAYDSTCDTPRHPGQILVNRQTWTESSSDELASTLAHELTHALQELSTEYPCGCDIEKEVFAFRVKLFVYKDLGRQDLLEPYSALWKEDGSFDEARLREVVKKLYPKCEGK